MVRKGKLKTMAKDPAIYLGSSWKNERITKECVLSRSIFFQYMYEHYELISLVGHKLGIHDS